MKQSTVVICGLARDIESILPVTIAQVERLGEMFNEYRVVIFENDSTDSTLPVLHKWSRRNPSVTILSENYSDPVNPPTRCPNRMDRMARYRNYYREYVAEHYADFDYAVVVDTDLKGGWSLAGVANSFGYQNWDFMGSNGIIWKKHFLTRSNVQYDAWAFRPHGDASPLKTSIVNKMVWQRAEPLLPVYSCFGGLGVYRMPALVNCRYSGPDCEHVFLHQQMIEQGMDRLYLNPSQLTLYGSRYGRLRRLSRKLHTTTSEALNRLAIPHRHRSVLAPSYDNVKIRTGIVDRAVAVQSTTTLSLRLYDPDAVENTTVLTNTPTDQTNKATQNTIPLVNSEARMKIYDPESQATTNHAGTQKRAVLLTCYMTGADKGANLGTAGYSYDFVAKIFMPLLAKWGEVIPVPNPEQNLDRAASDARARGLSPIHVSFLPFQDAHLARSAPNVVVPAWEFPDIPNDAFDDNPQNNWAHVANQCKSVIVGGPFTKRTFEAGGIDVPVHIVPVPTPTEYFDVPQWEPESSQPLSSKVYFPKYRTASGTMVAGKTRPAWQHAGRAVESLVRNTAGQLIGRKQRKAMRKRITKKIGASRFFNKKDVTPTTFELPLKSDESYTPSGIVYTSIFNPTDGRKNWQDLLTAFQTALADCEDATLLVKLITSRPAAAMRIINYYNERDIPHRCKVHFIADYLSNDQMVELAQASTFYLQTTRAEGNCLPIMNFLAAGRPAISPSHSAIQDYFADDMGFVVESNPEPAAWPHDPQLRLRTSWGRLVWPSLVEQIRNSYEIAKNDAAQYQQLSNQARAKMMSWSHANVVGERLIDALDATVGVKTNTTGVALRKAA